LLVFERKVLQTICGLKIENGVYRGRYNKKLYSEPNPMEGEIKEDRNPGGRMG
jgi:hypothetical protein